MASQKLMKFMIDLVNQYGLSDYIEKANDKDGNFLPIFYAFGQVTAKACVIRFKTQDLAKEIMRDLRNNGTIEFEGAGETQNSHKLGLRQSDRGAKSCRIPNEEIAQCHTAPRSPKGDLVF